MRFNKEKISKNLKNYWYCVIRTINVAFPLTFQSFTDVHPWSFTTSVQVVSCLNEIFTVLSHKFRSLINDGHCGLEVVCWQN